MTDSGFRYIYGPVPSRRLGLSLGVDIMPFKTCTYDCSYCQLGRTMHKTVERREYIPVGEVLAEVEQKLADGPVPDYVTLSGSGEPTLNENIGQLIREIKKLTYIPLAVITNGSLLWQHEVQDALMEADLVLPSLDAGDEFLFRKVNRPHQEINFEQMVHGLAEFTRRFSKPVWLEVFLLAAITGMVAEVKKIAALVKNIQPQLVQLNTVSRPPSENSACPISWNQMKEFADLFDGKVEVISDNDKSLSAVGPDATDADILALLSRRPCTDQEVSAVLSFDINETAKRLRTLVEEGSIKAVQHNKSTFFETAKMEKNKVLRLQLMGLI
jgi:wyosine [tRNA(Phe)-imidazoG37] synthetase (radical SAM superfamily)